MACGLSRCACDVARFVEIFQVKCIVPDLVNSIARVIACAYFEFQNEYDVFKNQHRVDPQAQSRNVVFEEQGAAGRCIPVEQLLQERDLLQPGHLLRRVDGKAVPGRQRTDDKLRIFSEELGD